MSNPFEKPDLEKWIWQTTHPVLAKEERRLLEPITRLPCSRFLELGCGDGGNLFHLRNWIPASTVGLDVSPERVQFASGKMPETSFVCGQGERLPFPDNCFNVTLIRDVLHHVSKPIDVLREAERVTEPKGILYVLEPNGRNPVMAGWAIVAPFDRGILKNSEKTIGKLFRESALEMQERFHFQPMPLSRVLFHYKFGIRGHAPFIFKVVQSLEAMFSRLTPKRNHAYLGFLLRKGER